MSWYRKMKNKGALPRGAAFKRALDLAGASAGLVALSPLLGAVAGLELVFHGWPPVFVQVRPGLYGEPFKLIKFRSMSDARGPDGALLPDAERLTPFGRFLRSSSIDELPELLNVIKGEMSLVGPRPLLMRYLERYSADQMRRHDLPPGITGWAQIHGRNALSWPEKFALDLHYIDHFTPLLDLEILWKTVSKVIAREGISAAGDATMPEFMGNEG